jgi:L-asparaginase II
MLLACRLLGLPAHEYAAPEHPLQQAIRRYVAELSGLSPEKMEIATDGCSLPTFRLPLQAAARAYAVLAAPEAGDVADETRAALRRIVEGMTRAPEMVSGPGRFTTRLMEVTQGRIVAKEGAKGFYALDIRGPAGLGVALKIADGCEVCRDGVVLEILRQLGSLSLAELEALAVFYRKPLRTHRGASVGELAPAVELETSSESGALIPSAAYE